MPYDYRRMSQQQRDDIVAYRRERGYPLHAPPHPLREAGWYFITSANYEHSLIMADPVRRDEFESRLIESFRAASAEIGGWIVLPNHYHVLAGVDSLDVISSVLKRLHGATSREWNQADQVVGRRVWYKFMDRWIRGERHYYQALNYIHINPAKHGWVEDPYAWPWSSVHLYHDTKGKDWLRATWRDYPIPTNFAEGMDP